jgi:uncharacterized protein YcfJ
MKKLLTATVISALGLASGAALARPYGDMGRVIEARPVYESVATTTQQCWTQPVTRVETQYVPQTSGAGAVLGALVGGALGAQAGDRHHGRDHGATVAGALIGGLIGNAVEGSRNPAYAQPVAYTQPVQRCRPVQSVANRVVAYDVRYEYRGREYRTRTVEAPGRFIPVNVAVYARPAPVAPVYVRSY